ncbi:GapA-binding peptide SR1P [Fervidibacillus halotolerans]|uniref:GapA-binding peptide SR1P n=1 Tax=Fervidibacillus halotolerans TaxID=2980027 RepID=A0A9E8M2D4_9BACI|nr:GapA-binding peptide SR1P [Fervidibacillus halotolerans]WAA13241.1 GapA-binding peptide SR1P [Fervidibacillus halotolerans]
MGTLVCQVCQSTIDYFEHEKVTVLYGTCSSCKTKKSEKT